MIQADLSHHPIPLAEAYDATLLGLWCDRVVLTGWFSKAYSSWRSWGRPP
jgi:hypothetical protein